MNRALICSALIAFCLVADASAQGQEPCDVVAARESSRIAGYSLGRVNRWLHEVALKKIEPKTGLYHPDGAFNYRDAWADCYPFLLWAAWATDLQALNGQVRSALHAEIKHCPDDFFTRPENFFGGSEYVKDGLVAIIEVTGRDEWFDRMRAIEDQIWSDPKVETPYGNIPSTNVEINGEQIQALVRIFTMTGEKKYLEWAERIADHYLLPGKFVPSRLRDHGCEIIGGLGLLLGVESVHNTKKAKQYLPHMKRMLDAVIREGTNEDGIMFNLLGKKAREKGGWRTRLSDGWGYNYVANLCYDMAVGKPIYRQHIRQTLRNLARPVYATYRWEGDSIDGWADSIEGGIYLLNRLPVHEGLTWVDRGVDRNIVYRSGPLKTEELWGTMKLQSNGVRTAIIHALQHTRGLRAFPLGTGLEIGAAETREGLTVVMRSPTDWSGKLVFDGQRHRTLMGFQKDWPRMNTLPEWFTVKSVAQYLVIEGSRNTIVNGSHLLDGLKVTLKAGEEQVLRVQRVMGEKPTCIGVYDSRSVAVAFVGSHPFDRWMSGLRREHRRASEAGDTEAMSRLEKEGQARQEALHRQGFSTAPVDGLLALIGDRLSAIRRLTGVQKFVSCWDEAGLKAHGAARRIDVTRQLIESFDPSERQRRWAIEAQEKTPVPIEDLDHEH